MKAFTAKSWLSEHLAAAINGDSGRVVQGTAGTTEEQIRYTWNYAMLIAQGPSNESLIKSPIYRAMESGSIARFEEVTRTVNTCKTGIYFHTEHPYTKGATALVAMNYNPREAGMTIDQPATVVRVESLPGSHMRGVAMQFH